MHFIMFFQVVTYYCLLHSVMSNLDSVNFPPQRYLAQGFPNHSENSTGKDGVVIPKEWFQQNLTFNSWGNQSIKLIIDNK